ncbi:hypothetical protein L9F63_003753, partial [Diploptera punctata]
LQVCHLLSSSSRCVIYFGSCKLYLYYYYYKAYQHKARANSSIHGFTMGVSIDLCCIGCLPSQCPCILHNLQKHYKYLYN